MKQLIFITSALLLSLSLVPSFAQVANDKFMPHDYSIIPPSPEVSSLMKYTEIPVSYFSGLPQIDIPIYELKEGKLSVPISLNYHGGGIKVTEVEGEVGLGWALMAGACISRTVYGHPDDIMNSHDARGLFNLRPEDNSLRQYIIGKGTLYDPSDYIANGPNLTKITGWNKNYEDGLADMANDVYQISGMGLSGTFIYNDSKNLVLSSSSGISVQPSMVNRVVPSEYVITDAAGTKYYFGQQEFTKYEYSYGIPTAEKQKDSIEYVSAWHLTKIKNIENDSIIFYYKSKGRKDVNYGGSQTCYYSSQSLLSGYISDFVSSSGRVRYKPQALIAIQSNSAIVRFSYDEAMDHVTGIGVYRYEEPVPKKEKQYVFDYSHFTEADRQKQPLKLDAIREISAVNAQESNTLYSFGYYDDGRLPFEFAYQDFCGYFNDGKNTFLVPYINVDHPGWSANRDVNIEASLYGSLTSITYPTGGKTLFQWEPHEFGYLKNVPVTKTSHTVSEKTYVDTLVGLIPASARKLVIDNYILDKKRTLYLDLSKYFAINPDSYYDYGYSHTHSDSNGDRFPRVVFWDKTSGTQKKTGDIFYIDESTVNRGPIPIVLNAGTYKIELQYPTELDRVDEYFLGYFNQADADWGKVYITRKETVEVSNSQYKDYWGGLRIGSVVSMSGNENDVITKEYIYSPLGDPYRSTGVIDRYPYYESFYYLTAKDPQVGGWMSSTVTAVSSSGLYKTPLGGQKIEYPKVYERYCMPDRSQTDPTLRNIIVEYNYTSQNSEEICDYNNSDYRDMQARGSQMWTSKSHYRGNLVSKKIIGLNDELYAETNYTYNIFENPDQNIFTTDLFKLGDFTHTTTVISPGYANDYSIGKYSLIQYNKTTKSEETVEYKSGTSADKIKTKIEYTYFYNSYTSNKDYALVRSKITVNPLGERRETFYTYMYKNGQYLNIPETEVTVMNGVILSAKRMEYYPGNSKLKTVYTITNRGVSASAYSLGSTKDTSPALKAFINKPEYTYLYDRVGNLSEISYNGEVLASYLWGYKGLYPIVEVKNLPYDELADGARSLGFEPEAFTSSTGTAEPQFSNFIRDLRDKFSGYEVTSMTYHWLIGVSTATDSRGVTTHFTYDDFGRLSDVKDYNGYFIRKYDYHYAEPE